MARRRVGGLGVDPEVAAWQRDAAVNRASLTRKQRRDRVRVRARYDLPAALKEAVEAEAKQVGTSASQLAAFLIAWAMKEHKQGNAELRESIETARESARTMRFEWNLELPEPWLDDIF